MRSDFFAWRMFYSENRFPPHSASKTRVNALMIKSGAGFVRNMRYAR